MPILFVFSENDKLVEKEIFYEMTDILGADKNNFIVYDEQGLSESESQQTKLLTEDKLRVVVFQSGGHYAFLKYPEPVDKAVTQFLNTLVKPSAQSNPREIINAPSVLSANSVRIAVTN